MCKLTTNQLILIILILQAFLSNADARYSTIDLSLDPPQVAPDNISNIKIDIKSSNDVGNITYAAINIKMDSSLKRPEDKLESATGFLEPAELKWVDDESKWSIWFDDPKYDGGSYGSAEIPVASDSPGTYDVSIQEVRLDDNHGRIEEIRRSNPLRLNCSYPPKPTEVITENPQTAEDGNGAKIPYPSCVEVNLQESAYIYEPVEFTAKLNDCGNVDWCRLTFANSTEIKKWDKVPPPINHVITIKHVIEDLPFGKHKLEFEAWNENGEIQKEMNISIVDLKLNINRTILKKEVGIDEPFDIIIEVENNNRVAIQNLTVRMELPDGIVPSEGLDFKVLNSSVNGYTVIETIPENIPAHGEVYWGDIKLKGLKNNTIIFPSFVDGSFYYNNHLENFTTKVVPGDVTIVSPKTIPPFDWIDYLKNKLGYIFYFFVLGILYVIANYLNNHFLKKMHEAREGIIRYIKGEEYFEEAHQFFKNFLDQDDMYFIPHYYMGMILWKRGKSDDAAKHLNDARKNYPPLKGYYIIHFINIFWLKHYNNVCIPNNYPELDLMLCVEDILKPNELIKKLKSGDDKISKHLRRYLRESTKNELKAYEIHSAPSEDIIRKIIWDINKILLTTHFPKKADRAIQPPKKNDCFKRLELNRAQLDDAYSEIVKKSTKFTEIW